MTNTTRSSSAESTDHETSQLSAAHLPEFPDSTDLERFTGTPASTWRYWAHIGTGPRSFKIGRRRVWRKIEVLRWLDEQEINTQAGGSVA